MATKPDLGRDVGKLEGSVSLLTKLSFTIIGFLGIVAAGGAAILIQFGGLSNEIALVRKDVSTANEKLTKIERDMAEVRTAQSSVASVLGRIETQVTRQAPPSPSPQMLALKMSPNDTRTLWEILGKIPPPMINFVSVKLGEKLPMNTMLLDFPTELISKVPQLKGLKYTFDQNSIVIVDATDNRVMAIVPPA